MNRHGQRGVTAVEFALVAGLVFLPVLLAIMDFGRLLYTWNATAEATRVGARVSVVCNRNAARVLTEMQKIVPAMTDSTVHIDWYDAAGAVSGSCNSTNCAGVAVRTEGLTITPVSPLTWLGFSTLPVPAFSTYLPREVMGQDPDSGLVCS